MRAGPPRPVLVTLGSNIDPAANLRRAVALLAERCRLRAVSRVYESEAVGSPGPPFLNAAVLLSTALPPERLKAEVLRPLEARLGRVRTADPNAPRTIDLDLALDGDRVLDRPGLRLPDPEIRSRAHVALPLADLAPDAVEPLSGETLGAIAARFAGVPGIRVRDDLSLEP